ncbi:ABC transporter permease [Flavobacterium sp. ANB]|uniref:ABC transporter permease n=1 Tax=unclassified Flavobacterium TaxID=196869 RepID=UPI0012B72F26|nr:MULTISPECIES: ABC transporter permease [unclassified Flavobacterium]MBF4517779.1 ABC transporter permease [Flavobacterium sp. ANB]MTD70506.1 FtsX-like permease family protein [Flavobacterium sp. LC2016-13]
MLKNWINIFIYHIKNNKFFTALNVLGLSIGIAGLIFAILYWNEEQSYNEWNPNKEVVFQSICQISPDNFWSTNVSSFEDYFKTDFKEIESYCYLDNWYAEKLIQYNDKKGIFKIIDAQKTFFEMFPFNFIKGSAKTALKDKSCIAISKQMALNLFGNIDVLGKTVIYTDKKLVVTGVYTIPGKSSLAPEAVVNLIDEKLPTEKDSWGNFNNGLLIKLKNPADKNKVIAKMESLLFKNRTAKWAKKEGLTIAEWQKKNGVENMKIFLEPLKDARLHSIVDGYAEGKGNYQFLMIMMGLSVLILILSLFNYINLATANAIKRAKEVGVRKILGASKSNIVLQFIFETFIITSFSILLSLVIVELSLPFYNNFLEKELAIHGSQFFVELGFIFIVTVILAGIFPALYISNFETLKVLKGNFGRSKSGVWLRNGMLILQFAIAAFFIIGSYIVYEQVQFLTQRDLGFKGDQVLEINYRKPYFDPNDQNAVKNLYTRYETVKQEISKIKGVSQVSTGAFSFGGGGTSSSTFSYHGINIQGQNMAVDFGMLEMLKIKLSQGRYFDSRISSDTITNILINETALKLMKEKNPIGKIVKWNEHKLKIIGIVKNFNIWGPKAQIPPMVFFHLKTISWMNLNVNHIFVKVNPAEMQNTIADLEKFWKQNITTDYPFKYDFTDKAYARNYKEFVNQRNLFSLLNIIVILIALFGLFALASYSIQSRMKEIAIRKTLGAETNVLLKELSKQYIIFCVIGFLIAVFPAYYLLNKWLEDFVFRIDIPILPFLIGFVALLSLTLIVVLSRTYQATKVDVLKYLKYE